MLINKSGTRERHYSLEVTMSGLVINLGYSWLGVSPDGAVHDPGCIDPNGLLEIKYPYNYRGRTPFQAACRKGFVVGWKK